MTGQNVVYRLAVPFDAKDLLAAGQDRLARRQLQTAPPGVFDQLVDDLQRRRVARDAHLGTDAEAVHRRAGGDDTRDLVLVEAAAGEDGDLRQPGVIEDAPRGEGQLHEIARIETDAADAKRRAQLLGELHDLLH